MADQFPGDARAKDTIPRVRIPQILGVASFLAARGAPTTFDAVRLHLLKQSARRAPGTQEAMWAIARDVLSELSRLGYAQVGPLPRKRSEVFRLAGTPCTLTDAGRLVGIRYKEQRSAAFDELLIAWIEQHPYFRQFMQRLLADELFVPDITSIKQIANDAGDIDPAKILENVLKNIAGRMRDRSLFDRWALFAQKAEERFSELAEKTHLRELDAKRLVDAIQDFVVLPSFLEAEKISTDAVTFQHLLRAAQDFLTGAWTASYPTFVGRVVFATCDLKIEECEGEWSPSQVSHHGMSFAENEFPNAVLTAYQKLIGAATPTYVDAYALRALVCTKLHIQPLVFQRCLAPCIANRAVGDFKIFTELPFSPPPAGEDYVRVGSDRIGLVKLST